MLGTRLGADLGGNATAVGASANVVIIGIAARNGHPISLWNFTKSGALTALATVTIAWVLHVLPSRSPGRCRCRYHGQDWGRF